jgi:glyoxylase-like metal-dependent hydrolase (beta-lactamase superfamily II)
MSDNFILIPGRVAIAFIKVGNEAYMVDSGLDKDQARRAINIAKELSLTIKLLINTHSHADHIGGNKFVADRLGIPIYADKREIPYITMPILEASTLYGGYPSKSLRNKFFIAQESHPADISGISLPFDIHDLRGHSPGMIGLQINHIFFVADAFFPLKVLKRHVIPYTYNPRDALDTLNKLRDLDGLTFVPSHGDPTGDEREDIEANIRAIISVREKLLEIIRREMSFDEISIEIFSALNIDIRSIGLYHLHQSILRGYLTWLEEEDCITPDIKGKKLVWKPNK